MLAREQREASRGIREKIRWGLWFSMIPLALFKEKLTNRRLFLATRLDMRDGTQIYMETLFYQSTQFLTINQTNVITEQQYPAIYEFRAVFMQSLKVLIARHLPDAKDSRSGHTERGSRQLRFCAGKFYSCGHTKCGLHCRTVDPRPILRDAKNSAAPRSAFGVALVSAIESQRMPAIAVLKKQAPLLCSLWIHLKHVSKRPCSYF